jgi:isoleucyl-tRNA synthetase
MNFSNKEQNIMKYWSNTNMKEQLKCLRADCPQWTFLDGPPFINGSPHHGHLLVSSIKDTVARYMSQKGFKIPYQIGFDCHGLPLEQKAEEIVGKVSPNDSIERITEFCNQCRTIISSCSRVWYDTLGRLGRQFDEDQSYYTCDFSYMQSLWWAFGKLWKNGLIYKSKKVMPYSPKCETPLSNFEATSNYQERTDISVYVKFQIINVHVQAQMQAEYLLIWTTTPWSLFANQGICVNAELSYSLVLYNDEKLWLCTDTLEKVLGAPNSYTIIKTVLGSELVGFRYKSIFNIFGPKYLYSFSVFADPYVQNSSGTGLVHLAPLFGEDDMRVMKNNHYNDTYLPTFLVNSQVQFNISYIINEIDIKDKFVMDTSLDIVIHLKKEGYALKSEKIKHSYPYCWRTDFPLIYMAVDAWFMNVQAIIPELVENNKKIHWYPEHVGTERFANWIKNSPDWCLSRNRVWGTPIPVWVNDSDVNDMICIDTVTELESYTGQKYNDLHLDKLVNVTFTVPGKIGTFKRTFGVLDCWFESGMAPLARHGYPKCMNESINVDFIAESLDQTRGWFYTLNVLSTALNHTFAFNKVIVSGLILAADGKKMSKRLNNYTSPDAIIEKYGADVFRLYLLSSPASKAESFCFKDEDLCDITRKLLPYYNAHSLLNEYYKYATNTLELKFDLTDYNLNDINNKLDLWIYNKFMEFAKKIYNNMEQSQLTIIPKLIYKFIDDLCNVYIKLSRERMKMIFTVSVSSLKTLYYILKQTNHLLSPYMPHLTEEFNMNLHKVIYDNYTNYKSVHLDIFDFGFVNEYIINTNIVNGFYSISELIETVRSLRLQYNKPVYYPLQNIELYTNSGLIMEYKEVLCHELNIKDIIIQDCSMIPRSYKANKALLGKIYKKDASTFATLIESGNITFPECIPEYYMEEYAIIDKSHLNLYSSKFNYTDSNDNINMAIVYLNVNTSKEQDDEAEINNIRRQVNNIRKEMGLKIFNKIEIHFENNELLYNRDLVETLMTRLNTVIKIHDCLDDYMIIETFNHTKLKVKIIVL